MTVLVVGVPEGEELERLRSRIQRNPHFQVISHARTPDVALAHARVLLPDITVLTLAGGFRDDPAALGIFHGVRALDPPSGVVLRTRADAAPGDLDGFTVEGAVHIVELVGQAAVGAEGRDEGSAGAQLVHSAVGGSLRSRRERRAQAAGRGRRPG
ncbi:hypothetical protein [Streptomyces sp. NBC_01443]|uniref:hypothetical protein n=1 Tax=Streptomyces sp. NBC_01443 TaxID=2903868 RepID=UPI0022588EF6|nr:hypothetical protein [Streptomyces sp. NBC_01443]MCX4632523.1 hypothetical protein [Streptomyces sp. NBC_01443]